MAEVTVRRYFGGKADWFANGLPAEGSLTSLPRIAALADTTVPTCQLGDTIGAVRARAEHSGLCVVVNKERVVLGMLREKELKSDPALLVDDVMDPSPSTYRPNVSVDEMAQHLTTRTARRVLVSTADGILIGLLHRDAVEKAARRRDSCPPPEHMEGDHSP
jgi:CBS domain-containing protein